MQLISVYMGGFFFLWVQATGLFICIGCEWFFFVNLIYIKQKCCFFLYFEIKKIYCLKKRYFVLDGLFISIQLVQFEGENFKHFHFEVKKSCKLQLFP